MNLFLLVAAYVGGVFSAAVAKPWIMKQFNTAKSKGRNWAKDNLKQTPEK